MKEINNQKDFHQLMQSIDKCSKTIGKDVRTIPACIPLESQFMGKLLSIPKGAMKTYRNKLLMTATLGILIIIFSYWSLQKFMVPSGFVSVTLGLLVIGYMLWMRHIVEPNYKKEMFLHRKKIAKELLVMYESIMSQLQETHDLNTQFIESDKFTDTNVLWFFNRNITIEEKLDMYNTQKEFLEACLK